MAMQNNKTLRASFTLENVSIHDSLSRVMIKLINFDVLIFKVF